MSQRPDPLTKTAFIVDADKTPSSFFIRQWNLLLAFVEQTIGDISTLTKQVAAILGVRITTTAPIAGGGTLLNLQPISHNNSGVAPGTYGDTTHIPIITVDAKGHVDSVTLATIAPGASGSSVAVIGVANPVDTGQNSAFMGNGVVPLVPVTMQQLAAIFASTVNGGSYQAAIVSINGSNVVQTVAMSGVVVAVGTASQTLIFTFTPVALAPGTRYLLLAGRVGAGDTVVAHAAADNTTAFYSSFPGTTDGGFYEFPHAVPAIGQTATFDPSPYRMSNILIFLV